MNRFALIALTAALPATLAGCSVGAKLTPPRIGARVGPSAPPPASAPAPRHAASAPAGGGGGSSAPADDGCYQEFGQDAPGERHRAMPIEPGVPVDGCLDDDADRKDYFVVTAPASSGGVLYEFDYELDDFSRFRLEDADGIGLLDAFDAGARRRFWAVVAPNSPLYVLLSDDFRPYRLQVTETLIEDPDEPNDSTAEATPLRLGAPHDAMFASLVNALDRGRDVYAIDVPRGGSLHVDVIDPGSDIRVKLHVLNRDNEDIATKLAANRGANLRTDVDLPRPGRYFLVLSHGYNAKSSPTTGKGDAPVRLTKPYTITATLK